MFTPEYILNQLLTMQPRPTCEAPDTARGIYGLIDHLGKLSYIGSTKSPSQTLNERIHHRHRTGSEDLSHKFSAVYNTGRMYRDRHDSTTKTDGLIAKKLRNEFIANYCKAVWVPLSAEINIAALERAVINIAPKKTVAWNDKRAITYAEPTYLVDQMISDMGWDLSKIAAIDRQLQLFLGRDEHKKGQPMLQSRVTIPEFPEGDFKFYALDVETANNDRSSICQVGVACVRMDNSIETWVTHVDPKVDTWIHTRLHGIGPRTVLGAPSFADILPMIKDQLMTAPVYQHSSFDKSAIDAAAASAGLTPQSWEWRDSVLVARKAWPELSGNGGHGLASLKKHLNLKFEHHDAGEDARASAEIVLLAEFGQKLIPAATQEDGDEIFETFCNQETKGVDAISTKTQTISDNTEMNSIQITQGNLNNNHIYLTSILDQFPIDAIGGANKSSMARKMIFLDTGNGIVTETDVDGKKKIFRNRGSIKDFFARNKIGAGDRVVIEQTSPYHYKLTRA